MLPSVLLVIPLFVLVKIGGALRLTARGHHRRHGARPAIRNHHPAADEFRQVPRSSRRPHGSTGHRASTTLRRVVLPLVRPGLVAVAVFSFLTAWGEFVFALSFLPDVANQPISLGVFQFVGMYKTQWDSMMAFATLVAIPAVIAILLLKGQFVSGLTAGSVKA